MTDVMEFSKFHMHASLSQPSKGNGFKVFSIVEWFRAYIFKSNPAKSMVSPIYMNYLLGPLPALFLGDNYIPYVFTRRKLYVIFDYDLNWGDHDSKTCQKVYEGLAGLSSDVSFFAISLQAIAKEIAK
jgi:hypothetical protein